MGREDDIARTSPGDDAGASDWRDRIAIARAQAEAVPRPAPLPSRGDEAGVEIDPVAVPGYRLVRRISRGGQGAVYEALRNDTQRRVAIKLLKIEAAGPTPERVRFDREVGILRTLKDPRIVAVHEHGLLGSRAYFVMDYIEGLPLDEYLSSRPRTLRRTIELMSEICEAVESAHRVGIIHRDLKPANVLIDEEGRPYILDFGLAKQTLLPPETVDARSGGASEATRAGEFVGSLLWASPEQLDGDPAALDVRTDVYSLGVMLYQTLTGQFPYAMSIASQAAFSIRHVEPIRPRELHGDVDQRLEDVILRCLQKQPDRRYVSAGALAADLQRWLADEPVEAQREAGWRVRSRRGSAHGLLRVTAAARRMAESLLGRTVIADLAEIEARTSPQRLAAAALILLSAAELLAVILGLGLVATAFSAPTALDWVFRGFDLLIMGAYIFFVPATLGLVLLRPIADASADDAKPRRLPWRGAAAVVVAGALVAVLLVWKGRQSLTDVLAMTLAIAPGAALLRLIGRLLREHGERRLAHHARVEFFGLLGFGALALGVTAMRGAPQVQEHYAHVLNALAAVTLVTGIALGGAATMLLSGLYRVMRRARANEPV